MKSLHARHQPFLHQNNSHRTIYKSPNTYQSVTIAAYRATTMSDPWDLPYTSLSFKMDKSAVETSNKHNAGSICSNCNKNPAYIMNEMVNSATNQGRGVQSALNAVSTRRGCVAVIAYF